MTTTTGIEDPLSATEPAKIAIDDVSITFKSKSGPDVLAVKSVSFQVRPGEFVALVGPSGGGKTTLLNMISGLYKPDRGRIDIDGEKVTGIHPGLSYMPSRDALLPWRTVQRNVEYGLELRGVGKAERARIAAEMIAQVGLEKAAGRYPAQLSSGMRQRTAVARTFACHPEILLMDEPFSALDAQTRVRLQSLFLDLWERNRSTVLLVTHDVGEALALADRIVVLTSSPAVVKEEVVVDLGRPRDLRAMHRVPRYHELFAQVLDLLDDTEPIQPASRGGGNARS
ncbi:MAG: ABC transporter ATP-binding protein [Actinomycetota bacterium]|nr:ABC transporter ATP-binding protein [Actinomycetota bacterium]